MAAQYRATVYDPQGQLVPRVFKGKPIPGQFLVFERKDARRAFLSARRGEYPPGCTIKVTYQPKRVRGTALQAPEVVDLEAKWDGKQWIDVSTGQPVP